MRQVIHFMPATGLGVGLPDLERKTKCAVKFQLQINNRYTFRQVWPT